MYEALILGENCTPAAEGVSASSHFSWSVSEPLLHTYCDGICFKTGSYVWNIGKTDKKFFVGKEKVGWYILLKT